MKWLVIAIPNLQLTSLTQQSSVDNWRKYQTKPKPISIDWLPKWRACCTLLLLFLVSGHFHKQRMVVGRTREECPANPETTGRKTATDADAWQPVSRGAQRSFVETYQVFLSHRRKSARTAGGTQGRRGRSGRRAQKCKFYVQGDCRNLTKLSLGWILTLF